jgi:hypothetical protein
MGLVVTVFVMSVDLVGAVCLLRCGGRGCSVRDIWGHLEGFAVFETRLVVFCVTDS